MGIIFVHCLHILYHWRALMHTVRLCVVRSTSFRWCVECPCICMAAASLCPVLDQLNERTTYVSAIFSFPFSSFLPRRSLACISIFHNDFMKESTHTHTCKNPIVSPPISSPWMLSFLKFVDGSLSVRSRFAATGIRFALNSSPWPALTSAKSSVPSCISLSCMHAFYCCLDGARYSYHKSSLVRFYLCMFLFVFSSSS